MRRAVIGFSRVKLNKPPAPVLFKELFSFLIVLFFLLLPLLVRALFPGRRRRIGAAVRDVRLGGGEKVAQGEVFAGPNEIEPVDKAGHVVATKGFPAPQAKPAMVSPVARADSEIPGNFRVSTALRSRSAPPSHIGRAGWLVLLIVGVSDAQAELRGATRHVDEKGRLRRVSPPHGDRPTAAGRIRFWRNRRRSVVLAPAADTWRRALSKPDFARQCGAAKANRRDGSDSTQADGRSRRSPRRRAKGPVSSLVRFAVLAPESRRRRATMPTAASFRIGALCAETKRMAGSRNRAMPSAFRRRKAPPPRRPPPSDCPSRRPEPACARLRADETPADIPAPARRPIFPAGLAAFLEGRAKRRPHRAARRAGPEPPRSRGGSPPDLTCARAGLGRGASAASRRRISAAGPSARRARTRQNRKAPRRRRRGAPGCTTIVQPGRPSTRPAICARNDASRPGPSAGALFRSASESWT